MRNDQTSGNQALKQTWNIFYNTFFTDKIRCKHNQTFLFHCNSLPFTITFRYIIFLVIGEFPTKLFPSKFRFECFHALFWHLQHVQHIPYSLPFKKKKKKQGENKNKKCSKRTKIRCNPFRSLKWERIMSLSGRKWSNKIAASRKIYCSVEK